MKKTNFAQRLGSRSKDEIEEGRYLDQDKYGAGRIYSGKRSTALRGIHVDPTYTRSKALSIFSESIHFRFLGYLFGLLEHRRQNLTEVM
jgi:hypothetical protein